MKNISIGAAAAAASLLAATPLQAAQDAQAAPVAQQPVEAASAAPAAPAEAPAKCELHVWPTKNYLAVNTGLLSGFGVIGTLADMGVHQNKVRTVKDLMAEYLGPERQMEELNRVGIAKTLKLADYRVVVEEATPFNEELKANPALKARVAAMNARIKAKQRLSDSKHPCYAELITTHIFYHKAMMYGSNLFTGWIYREFGDKPVATMIATGQVKNPLGAFPPKNPEAEAAAKAELRDAYGKDFAEYVQKKVKR